jgi:transducin (beta)-like 1
VWNPALSQLASGSSDGMCRLWGLWEMDREKWSSDDSEIPLRTAILPHSSYPGERFKDVTSVSWGPDGLHLATGCYDGMVRIWDNQGNLKTVLKEHTGPVFSVKWTKTGNYILSGSYDRRSIVWDAKTGTIVKAFLLHAAPILDLDWKDSETFATCSSDMAIHVCSVPADGIKPIRTFVGHTDEVNAVCWSPGGRFLASCSDDSTAKIWSVENGGATGLVHDLRGHLKEIYTVRWTPTGPASANPTKPLLLCTASFDGTVKAWSAVNGSIVYDLRRQAQPVYSIAPSPTGDYLATGSLGGFVTVWSLHDGSLVHESKGGGDTFDVSWSFDSGMLCACFSSGVLQVLDYAQVLEKEKKRGATAGGGGGSGGGGGGSNSVEMDTR